MDFNANNPQPIGSVMMDLVGQTLSAHERELLAHPNTGGVILFTRNFYDDKQITALIKSIRASRPGPLLIAVDQEGGRVQRFQQGFSRLPAAALYAQNQELAHKGGWVMAAELLTVGVDFSFAPVLDIDCGISRVIGDRSFSNTPHQVSHLAGHFRSGMKTAGMPAVGKHFPGHGSVALDSHLSLPIDERTLEKIRSHDLLPFKQLIAEGLEGIMPAHVLYTKIDQQPAGFSHFWLHKILRQELGFQGAIFSDDLSMVGAEGAGNYIERAELAFKAGCEMLLVCNKPIAAEQVIEKLSVNYSALRENHLLAMRGNPTFTPAELRQSVRWQNYTHQLSSFLKTQENL